MSTVLREQGIITVHDQVVSWVAQRWAKAFHCKVTIHTSLEENPWADPQQECDIVGWQVSSAGNRMEWMAEVETNDSIKDVATVSGRPVLFARTSWPQGIGTEACRGRFGPR
jgi:hypothetical protein